MNIDPSIQKARIDTPLGPTIFGMQVPENIFQQLLKLSSMMYGKEKII